MNKSLVIFISIMALLTQVVIPVAAQTPNPNQVIQLKAINPNEASKPSVPNPNPTTPKLPTPPAAPKVPVYIPHEPKMDFCPSLSLVFELNNLPDDQKQRIIDAYRVGNGAEVKLEVAKDNSALFDFIYPKAQFIAGNKDQVLSNLQSEKAAFDTISSQFNTPGGRKIAIDLIQAAMNVVSNNANVVNTFAEYNLNGLTEENIDIFSFYYALFKVIDHVPEKYSQQVDGPYATLVAMSNIADALSANGWPKLPFVTVRLGSPNVKGSLSNYPPANSWKDAFRNSTCSPDNPTLVFVGTPLIYLYANSPVAVNIKIATPITFSDPIYSLLHGFSATATLQGSKLYYEFDQSVLSKNETGDLLAVVDGKDLKNYLLNEVLPKLGLNYQEITDYQKDIITQLTTINSQKNYQVNLLQNQQVDWLLPWIITPKPDSILRNMLIITPTLSPTFSTNYMINTRFQRKGLTIVENGLVVNQPK